MSTNQALLLCHNNMEHVLDRLSQAWVEDGVPTSSSSLLWPLTWSVS